MVQIPTQTLVIAVSAAVVLLALVVWGWRRYVRRHIVSEWRESGDEWASTPLSDVEVKVTIAVISQGGGTALGALVPLLARQRKIEAELVVVDADSADVHGIRTSVAVDRLMAEYPFLRRTYVPRSTSGLDPYDVGCMLAARAANYEWVVFVSPYFRPSSEEWLLDLLQYVDGTLSALVDYAGTSGDDELTYWERRRLRRQMLKAAKSGGPVATAGGSMIVQREWFLRRMTQRADGECLYLMTDPESHDRYAVRASCR